MMNADVASYRFCEITCLSVYSLRALCEHEIVRFAAELLRPHADAVHEHNRDVSGALLPVEGLVNGQQTGDRGHHRRRRTGRDGGGVERRSGTPRVGPDVCGAAERGVSRRHRGIAKLVWIQQHVRRRRRRSSLSQIR